MAGCPETSNSFQIKKRPFAHSLKMSSLIECKEGVRGLVGENGIVTVFSDHCRFGITPQENESHQTYILLCMSSFGEAVQND
jgi:hypothetical protein